MADSRVRRLALHATCLAVACIALYSTLSIRIPISSEIRYIESAREMAASGDWIVPYLAYVPYVEKPILIYWTGALSRLIGHESLVAIRLTSILASTISVLVTFFFALRLGDIAFATRAALVLASSAFFALFGSAFMTDPLFACWLWAAWFFYWESLQRPRLILKWGFWSCVSLGFMTKGPLAIALILGSIGLFHVMDTAPESGQTGWRAWRGRLLRATATAWRETKPGLGVVALVAINLPWTILVYRRDPRLLEFFYVRENFRAFFEGSIHHKQKFWFYAAVIAEALAPWTLPAVLGLLASMRTEALSVIKGRADRPQRSGDDRARLYLIAIVAFNLAFLQASSAKLETYILPIVPALSVLAVDEWTRMDARRSMWLRFALLVNAELLVLAFVIFLWRDWAVARSTMATLESGTRSWGIALVSLAVVSLTGGGILAVSRFWRGLALTGVGITAVLIGITLILPELHLPLNAGPLAHLIASRERAEDVVIVSSELAQDYAVQLELHHRVGIVGRARELGMGHYVESLPPPMGLPDSPYDVRGENTPQNSWLYSDARLLETWRSARRVWLICKQDRVDVLTKCGAEVHAIAAEGTMLLCSNKI